MQDVVVNKDGRNFSQVSAAMQRYVDRDILSGVSYAVLQGRELIGLDCVGWANKERREALRTDHLFRVASNTKLVTSCAVLLLMEEGRLALDDPIERYIPQLGHRRVLRAGATALDDTEPAHRSITVRHLLSHSSGLSYGLLDPGTLLFEAYTAGRVLHPGHTLAHMVDVLAELPLLFHPGTAWEYSIATDVLGHLIELLSGQRLDAFIQTRIFDRLGMADTGFVVPAEQRHRMAAYYVGADAMNPLVPGLTPKDEWPYPGAYHKDFPKLSGGSGLASSLGDMVTLVRSLLPGGDMLLQPATLAEMMRNQLPAGAYIRFAGLGEIPGKGFGLAGAVTLQPSSMDPVASTDEFQWGGIAGTHWWISPRHNLAAVAMTQRQMGFWHPYAFEFKQLVYRAAGV